MEITFSVVIPAHNCEIYIKNALESLETQILLPKEVIVVINGSSDNTKQEVEEYKKNSALNIIIIETNFGNLSNARNIGFSLAKSNYIAMLDADDIYNTDFLSLAHKAIFNKPDIAVFFTNRFHFNDSGLLQENFLERTKCADISPSIVKEEIVFFDYSISEHLFNGNFISFSGAVVNKLASYEAGLFSTRLKQTEDREFFIRLLIDRKSACTFKVCHGYRIHDKSITANLKPYKNIENAIKILESIRELHLSRNQIKSLKKSIRNEKENFYYAISNSTEKISAKRLIMDEIGISKKIKFILKRTYQILF